MLNRRKSILMAALIILGLALGTVWFSAKKPQVQVSDSLSHEKQQDQKQLYHCPMHPSVVSDEPGICPICHMDLQPIEGEEHDHGQAASEEGAAKERKIVYYRHPMQPDITSEVPAKDQMGMDYIPVYSDELEEAESEGEVSGRAGFKLNAQRQQMIGVTKAEVKKRPLRQEIRATGRVAFDPELFTAIEEYRQALIASSQMGNAYPSLKSQANALANSAKTKLKLMGLTNDQIRKLNSEADAMSLLLPKDKVWVYAEVFEYEVGGVEPGQKIEATAPSLPGKVFEGKISSISPVLNAPTRTVRVRAEVPDPEGQLRPDTFLNVKIVNDMGERLAVPEDAVMHTGEAAYVFVVSENGRFEPQPVSLGQKTRGFYEILSGVEAGDTVVTGANFLIDSESRLRAVTAQQVDAAASKSGASAERAAK